MYFQLDNFMFKVRKTFNKFTPVYNQILLFLLLGTILQVSQQVLPFISVYHDFLRGRVMDKQRGPETVPGVVNPVLPLSEPEALKGHQRSGQLVVDPDDPAKVA